MSSNQTELTLSQRIEDILVARNLRGMKSVQPHLESGYCLRAAMLLRHCRGNVFIGTGFPVVDTFETDGPVGSIALYESLEALGANPIIVCGKPISAALSSKYRVLEIQVGDHDQKEQEALDALEQYQPEAIVSIERPGQAADGGYYNMRGESISPRTACFDTFLNLSQCPTIAVGDGGNEIGMGNVATTLEQLNIIPSATCCDELLIADVSNWGAHGLIAMLSVLREQDMLLGWDNLASLQYLSERGSVDGVTRENRLTEDGLSADISEKLIKDLRKLGGFC